MSVALLNMEKFVCALCDKRHTSRSGLRRHTKTCGKLYCPYCYKSYLKSVWLNKHLNTCDKKAQRNAEAKYNCGTCDAKFKRRFTLNLHIKRAHSSRLKRRLCCEHCSGIFPTLRELISHREKLHLNWNYSGRTIQRGGGVPATTADDNQQPTSSRAADARDAAAAVAVDDMRDLEKTVNAARRAIEGDGGSSDGPSSSEEEEEDAAGGGGGRRGGAWRARRIGKFVITKTAFDRKCITYRRVFKRRNRFDNVEQALSDSFSDISRIIFRELVMKRGMRFSIIANALYKKYGENGELVDHLNYRLRGKAGRLTARDLNKTKFVARELKKITRQLKCRQYDLELAGSGWILDSCTWVSVELLRTTGLGGGFSADDTAELIEDLPGKRFLHDISSNLNECFYEAVSLAFVIPHMKTISHLCQKKQREFQAAATRAIVEEKLVVLKSQEGSVTLEEIGLFESRNKELNLAINVVYRDSGSTKIYPVRISQNNLKENAHIIYLLMVDCEIEDEDALDEGDWQMPAENDKIDPEKLKKAKSDAHYFYISDLDSFLAHRYHTNNGARYRRIHCPNCLSPYSTLEAMHNHLKRCATHDKPQLATMPEKGEYLSFTNYQRSCYTPIVGFLDFEVSAIPMSVVNVFMSRELNAILSTNFRQQWRIWNRSLNALRVWTTQTQQTVLTQSDALLSKFRCLIVSCFSTRILS